jgi:Cdc6-like AAA superfamily ATPase
MEAYWQTNPNLGLFRDSWIPYPQGEAVLRQLGNLLEYPVSVRTPGLLIYGSSNSGKTMVATKFKRDVDEWYSNEKPDATTSIVQMVETPPDKPTPKAIYRALLQAMNAPTPSSHTSERLLEQVVSLYQKNNVQMLIIDELHNIGTISNREQITFLNALKYLSNVANIRVVAIGIEEAYRILQLDQQLGSRFRPCHLHPWAPNDMEYGKFILQLIQSADFPLTEENQTTAFVENVHDLTGGLTGETKDLIMTAAELARRSGTSEINLELLGDLNWEAPSMRYR